MDTKQCSKCGEVKPLSAYYRRRDSKDGKEGRCKSCADLDKKDPEKRKAITKRYYWAHKELSQKRTKEWKAKNRDKYLLRLRQYRKEHPQPYSPEKARRQTLKVHGITPQKYNEMLEYQEGTCAICGQPPERRRLAVDHDHVTGQIRGLLCRNCNTALGLVGDSPLNAILIAAYLMEHGAKGVDWFSVFRETFPKDFRGNLGTANATRN